MESEKTRCFNVCNVNVERYEIYILQCLVAVVVIVKV